MVEEGGVAVIQVIENRQVTDSLIPPVPLKHAFPPVLARFGTVTKVRAAYSATGAPALWTWWGQFEEPQGSS